LSTPTVIEAPDDPRITDYVGLRDPARRMRVEADGRFFICEGITVVRRLLESDLAVRSLLLTPDRIERLQDRIHAIEAPVYVAPRRLLERVVGFDLHRGVLASADRPAPPDLDAILPGSQRLLVLEGLNDHENLGAITRSAVGLGVQAIVLDPTCADPYYRRSVRVSMGAVLSMPFVRAGGWPAPLGTIRRAGFTLVAMTLRPDAIPLSNLDPPDRWALMMGAEGPGLATETIELADLEVTIPMVGTVDSLNVGHAAAIALSRLGRLA
jgi:tRNA G18 (ribose-2'-O)-methylase SpoU